MFIMNILQHHNYIILEYWNGFRWEKSNRATMSQNDNRDCVPREAFDPDIFQPRKSLYSWIFSGIEVTIKTFTAV